MSRFQKDSLDFFLDKKASHMGAHQYAAHRGVRGGQSMSGALLWAELESSEHKIHGQNIICGEEKLIREVSRDLSKFLPHEMPVLEFGPGTQRAFKTKTLPIMMSLRSTNYIGVDASASFLKAIEQNAALQAFDVKTIRDDFFQGGKIGYAKEGCVLGCMFGATIGNMLAPISNKKPEKELVSSLVNLASKMEDGWLLLSFDSSSDGDSLTEYYKRHTDFHLNVFYRMQSELDMKGDFLPEAFGYEALWIAESGQMAHMAVVMRDMSFSLGGKCIHLKKGQRLHLKNSFKFSPSFFVNCCSQAGLISRRLWSDPSQAHICLLQKSRKMDLDCQISVLAA